MAAITRRAFLDRSKRTGLGLATGITILANARSARATPANEKVVLAAVGIGGRGYALAKGFCERGDCQYAYFADVDIKRAEKNCQRIAKDCGVKPPKAVRDFRQMLDDKSIDAIIVATPDHWHAAATIWGCQAKKDVYVEKPVSQNAWEGQKMVEAARKYNCVVQAGTQNRSAPYNFAAKKAIDDGLLGDIHMCRVYNQKYWGNMKAVADSDAPAGLDWDYWNGPAPAHRYNATLHHGWHHFWRYSGGDIINDASHQIDLARWLCGVTYPQTVYSTGGRYAGEGAFETPDTQVAVYQFDKLVMTFELTLYTPYMLKTCPQVRDSDQFPLWHQNATRIELYGTEAMMVIGRMGGGWQVFVRTKNRKPVVKDQMYGRFPDPEHKANFIRCVRSRKRPNADIREGHRSALLSHYANISYRTGQQKLVIDHANERIVDNDDAMKLFKRQYREPWVIREKV